MMSLRNIITRWIIPRTEKSSVRPREGFLRLSILFSPVLLLLFGVNAVVTRNTVLYLCLLFIISITLLVVYFSLRKLKILLASYIYLSLSLVLFLVYLFSYGFWSPMTSTLAISTLTVSVFLLPRRHLGYFIVCFMILFWGLFIWTGYGTNIVPLFGNSDPSDQAFIAALNFTLLVGYTVLIGYISLRETFTMRKEFQRDFQREKALRETTGVLYATLDQQEVLDKLTENLALTLNATSAYICNFDQETKGIKVISEFITEHAAPGEDTPDTGVTYYFDINEDYMQTLQPEQYHFDDPTVSSDERQHLEEMGCKSTLIIPLNVGGEVSAFMELWESREKRVFSDEEIKLAVTLGHQAAIALENARLYTQAQQEIKERKEVEERLRLSEKDYRGLFENAHDAIIVINPESGIVMDVNQRACELFSLKKEDFIGFSIEKVNHYSSNEEAWLQQILKVETNKNFEAIHVLRGGREIYMEVNASIVDYKGQQAIQSIIRDVSLRKVYEKKLQFDALHDSLTSLPNRALFMDRLHHAMAFSKRDPDYTFAVLFMDLDNFKNINDTLGHSLGDEFLVRVGRRLEDELRDLDTIARLGGDEFVILVEDIKDIKDLNDICMRFLTNVSKRVRLQDQYVYTTTSMGVVVCKGNYEDVEDIIRDADIAMYRAKEKGGNRFEFFDAKMRLSFMARLAYEQNLRTAFTKGEFEVYYQPIYSLKELQIIGFEALLRWQRPTRDATEAYEFITVVEDIGLVVPVGELVLHKASSQLQAWREKFSNNNDWRVFINVSSQQLVLPGFVNQIKMVLQIYDLPPEYLGLEVTERVFITEVEQVKSVFKDLKEIGVKIHLDDFGKGYSSLSYLYQLPIDAIKIDISFIARLGDQKINDLIKSMVSMAHDLEMKVVAEGIETKEQLDFLQSIGCDFGQGWYFHPALPPEKGEELFKALRE